MTKFLNFKLSAPLAVAALLASSPVLAIDSDSDDVSAHAPAPVALFEGEDVIVANPLTADLFTKQETINKTAATEGQPKADKPDNTEK